METLTQGAAIVGLVNIIGILLPNVDSKVKVGLVLLIGIISAYIPFTSPVITGIQLALASSGVYKLGQVVGTIKNG